MCLKPAIDVDFPKGVLGAVLVGRHKFDLADLCLAVLCVCTSNPVADSAFATADHFGGFLECDHFGIHD